MRFLKKDGSVSEYVYAGFPFRMYREMLAAKSIGIWFRDNVKDRKDKDGNLLYPYTKVEADPTLPASTTKNESTTGAETSTSQTVGEVVEGAQNLDTALAVVDGLKPDFVFVPGNMDKYLQLHRELALKEVAGLNPSTKKMRDAIKKTKAKVVHSRTFIEKMRVGYVFAEKQRLKKVDEESTRIQDIYHGIEDEVLEVTGYAAWEIKEKERVQKHENGVKGIREMQPHIYPDIPSLTTAIALLEEMDTDLFEEFSVPAGQAKEQTLEVLNAELVKRKEAEAARLELEELRKAEAERKEKERLAEAQKAEDARIAAAVEAAKVQTRQEVVAEVQANPTLFVPAVSISVAPVEFERVSADEVRVVQTVADENVSDEVLSEMQRGLVDACPSLRATQVTEVLNALVGGLIPHVSIQY
jgi:hypothetical protein